MPLAPAPYAAKQFAEINGRRMAYIDAGAGGTSIVFQHGNPTSSYLWRNVMPHCEGLGRLVACDLIGMGDSDKLARLRPRPLHLRRAAPLPVGAVGQAGARLQHRARLHDWGSALGFEWARTNPDRVAGIVYMEAIVTPVTWADWPENARRAFQGFRSAGGEDMILAKNMFVERVLPGSVMRKLTDEEMAEYRRPFANPGEDRRPTLTWPRQIPIEGEPADVVAVVDDYSRAGSPRARCRSSSSTPTPARSWSAASARSAARWPNQTEITVKGLHFLQEDSPDDIGRAVADFVRRVRLNLAPTSSPSPLRGGVRGAAVGVRGGGSSEVQVLPQT